MASNLKDNHWTRDAACGFEKDFLSFDQAVVYNCKTICARCPVRQKCDEWVNEIDGHFVAGGKSRYDRLMDKWKRIEVERESNFR